MICAHCEELQDEIAYLRSELGLAADRRVADKLRSALGILPNEARLAMRLFKAKVAVSKAALDEAMPPKILAERADFKMVDVTICRLRTRIGRSSIRTVWGFGYEMTPEGRDVLAPILLPKVAA